ncbi:glycosyltransferase family 4 protein [Aeromonas caviae]|uniref:glycosyltransferase family 4 protein n=1 Tax=Aeromonas caviae TaxID=648 RepID=UPI003F74232A
MIIYDGIIERLQNIGGISVLFKEIISRCHKDKINFRYFNYKENSYIYSFGEVCRSKCLERYRNFDHPSLSLNKIDKYIFHSTYYRLPKVRDRENIKVVTTVHDFTYERFSHGPAKWVHRFQKNRAIRNSDIIICVSHNTAKDLMRYCPVDIKKIRVVYNGVSDSYHQLEVHPNAPSKDVLFVGARNGYKNFRLAVQSVSRINDMNLHIVGGGALTRDELAYLNKYLPNRYRWLGRLTDEELNIEYNKAYALLYPSSYEGFGIPVIEAMRAGCPVIAVNSSSIPEVAGQAAILVDTISESSLCEALLSVPSQRQYLIDAGFVQAAKFSWEKCYQDTLSVYNELF